MEGWMLNKTFLPGAYRVFDPLKREADKVEKDCSDNAWKNSFPACNINELPPCCTSSNSFNILSNDKIQCSCASDKSPSTCDKSTQHRNLMCNKTTQHKSIPCDKTTQYSTIKCNKTPQTNSILCNKTTQYSNIKCNKSTCDKCTTCNIFMKNCPSTECKRLSSKNTDCKATCRKTTEHDTMCDKTEENRTTCKTSMKPSPSCKATKDCTGCNEAAKESGGSVLMKPNSMKRTPAYESKRKTVARKEIREKSKRSTIIDNPSLFKSGGCEKIKRCGGCERFRRCGACEITRSCGGCCVCNGCCRLHCDTNFFPFPVNNFTKEATTK